MNEHEPSVVSQQLFLWMCERLRIIPAILAVNMVNPWAELRRGGEEGWSRGGQELGRGESDFINGWLRGTWYWNRMPLSLGFKPRLYLCPHRSPALQTVGEFPGDFWVKEGEGGILLVLGLPKGGGSVPAPLPRVDNHGGYAPTWQWIRVVKELEQ